MHPLERQGSQQYGTKLLPKGRILRQLAPPVGAAFDYRCEVHHKYMNHSGWVCNRNRDGGRGAPTGCMVVLLKRPYAEGWGLTTGRVACIGLLERVGVTGLMTKRYM